MCSLDLRSELEIQSKVRSENKLDDGSPATHIKSSQPSAVSVGISTSPVIKTPMTGIPFHHKAPSIPVPQTISPSTRISALNMVGELLRKVGVSKRVSAYTEKIFLHF